MELIKAFTIDETQLYPEEIPSFSFETKCPYDNLEWHYRIIFNHLNLLNELIEEIHKVREIDYNIKKKRTGTVQFPFKEKIFTFRFSNELKILTDGLISINYLINYFLKHSKWPKKIKIDCIAGIIPKPGNTMPEGFEKFKKHLKVLGEINGIANAIKHSLLNNYSHRYTSNDNTPVVLAFFHQFNDFGEFHNDKGKTLKPFEIKLPDLVKEFNLFLDDYRTNYKETVKEINKKQELKNQ